MKKSGLIFIIILLPLHIWGQTISGIVKEKTTGDPIAYATVVLLQADSSYVTGGTTDEAGHFSLETAEAGTYIVKLSFIGYESLYKTIKVDSDIDTGEFFLQEKSFGLKEVVVLGNRPLIEQKIDRLVVHVSGNMITSGLNISEVLREMPGLVVNEDGKITLNGRGVTVYIDGRPTNLPASLLINMLNGMQGDAVDRVELISNPSARYDARQSASIVNIRLKRDVTLGLNGSVSASVGYTEYLPAYRTSLNLNYRSKKINIFGMYGFNYQPWNSDAEQIKNFHDGTPVTYKQYAKMKLTTPANTVRMGMDWFLSPKQTVGFLFNGTYSDRKLSISSNTDISRLGSTAIDSVALSHIQGDDKSNTQMYNLNYRLLTDTLGGELTADLDYGRINNHNWQNVQSHYFEDIHAGSTRSEEFQYTGPRNIQIYSLKLDLTKPLSSKMQMEAGLKAGNTTTDNEIRYENLINNHWEPNPNQSREFRYHEFISAAYFNVSYRFNRLTTMLGVRAEYTRSKGESATADTAFTHTYLDLFPNVFFQYKINEAQNLGLSYTRKINRPDFSLLDPFRVYVDPFTYLSGNPDLKPSYIHSVDMSYRLKRYSVNLAYMKIDDRFAQEMVQNIEDHTTGIINKNIGKHEIYSLYGFAPIQIAKWYILRINPGIQWEKSDSWYNGENFKNNYWTASGNIYNAFTILPTLTANFNFFWQKAGWDGITSFRGSNLWQFNGRIEKTFLEKRVSLSLSCNDIFSTYRHQAETKFQTIDQKSKQDSHPRLFLLTARYSFGSQKIRGARNRQVGIEDEINRTK
jgi:hypothetical protein